MRFSVAAVLAFATAVFAQTDGFDVISNPYAGEKVLAGKPCEIKWAPSTDPKFQGTVRIDVLGGATPQSLDIVGEVATGVDGSKGSYKWNVDPKLGTANTYGIKITLESNEKTFQYSFPFHIIGGAVDSDDATTVVVPTTTAAGTAKPLTVTAPATTAPATTKAATTTAKGSDAAETTSVAATGSASGSASDDASASSAVSSFSTVVSASASAEVSSTSDVVATASASSTSAVATGGAAAFGASTGALLGGVAMALFAL
ncbi:Ser-Thr-rich glycosyl-phosphatidyl-inositol-anchored membrane family-domain-containing protein [Pseudoneurospora amorphoporcata]|uniref:Ser-Thr-rich glycosyl-phosphatidyl-inositol-anchored membrane family-domain-containing protein n=1 Tax=Pseudoneurospora amorphoporcata TaxID=241081 RepID=A0AAN6P0A2_9PEZI|nr:Ser-Thr-rich glycosyl-phosphatidyl-inositol-anchored membrane family-domain-containing protein [Pseudoneurospora amorphoporcata]